MTLKIQINKLEFELNRLKRIVSKNYMITSNNKVMVAVLIIFYISNLFALSEETASEFIKSLLNNSSDLENFVLQKELTIDSRLGISYYNIEHKWLISYDIDSNIKELLQKKELDFSIQIENIKDQYSKLTFTTNNNEYQKEYYFYKDKYISPISYHTLGWDVRESEYFRFLISDTDLFHEQSIEQLDKFIKKTIETLQFTQEEQDKLKKEKIIYVFCKDTKEIKKITGYNARGLYVLASDAVITTFSCHYHELIHLLVNYKLKESAIYTHPFLLEGIAVALGGRGGKEPEIITGMGCFLETSGFLSYKELLSYNGFYQNDASLSYPVSGFYVSFLLKKIGVNPFLKLYRKYNSNNSVSKSIKSKDLPPDEEWNQFINDHKAMTSIRFPKKLTENIIIKKDNLIISETEEFYHFQTKLNIILFFENNIDKNYKSKQYDLLFPEKEYKGDKYLILINKEEINIYNLYTNNLIACYVSAFSPSHSSIPKEEGWFTFTVRKNVFNDNLSIMKTRTEL